MDSHANQRNPNGEHPRTSTDNVFRDTNKLDLRNEIQEKYRSHPVAWQEWVFQSMELPENSRVLELGAGTGTLWQGNADRLKSRIPASWEILLTDRALDMVQKARANLTTMQSGMAFLNLDGQALPFPEESFDAVIAIGLLDLVPDLNQAMSEAWRVLRPSGQLIATAGGKGHLEELEDLLRPYLPPGTAETLGGNEDQFGMENGEMHLARFFEEVVRRDYTDRLVFQELEPILEYALSEQAIARAIPLTRLGECVRYIRQNLEKFGKVTVTVRKGLFVARKKMINSPAAPIHPPAG